MPTPRISAIFPKKPKNPCAKKAIIPAKKPERMTPKICRKQKEKRKNLREKKSMRENMMSSEITETLAAPTNPQWGIAKTLPIKLTASAVELMRMRNR